MKKLFLISILIALMFSVKAQVLFPVNGSIGNPNANNFLYTINGGVKPTVGLILPTYTDTTAANANLYIKWYDGAMIKTTTPIVAIWYRYLAIQKWVQLLPSGGSTGDVGWLTVGNTWANDVDDLTFGTLSGNSILFKTRALTRLILDSTGILAESGTTVGLGYDPSNGNRLTQYSGGGGTPIVVSDSAWSLDGNNNASGKFLGTTNANDLIIKTNNAEQLRLFSTGGINIPATVDSTVGVIFKGSDRFIHDFSLPGANFSQTGRNLFIGRKSGNFTLTGSTGPYGTGNLGIGDSSLYSNTTGYRNVAIGAWNGNTNTTGYENTTIGAYSFQRNTTGYDNTSVGSLSMFWNTTGWRNTALGFSTLQFNTTGTRNTAIGGRTMWTNTTGFANVGVGFDALYGNIVGDHNVGVGLDALYWSDGTHNTAIGDSTLWGLYALGVKHMGYKNTAIGSRAGYHLGDTYPNFASIYDTAVTFLGSNASRDSSIPYTTSLQNMTVIGYDARGFASNQVVLGNDNVTSTLLKGSLNARGYGVGSYTGTPTYALQVDASGNIIEGSVVGSTPTWQQTLTAGSTLTTDNTVDADGNLFEITLADYINFEAGSTRFSNLAIYEDSISINPGLGHLDIDTLTNNTAQNTLMGWVETAGVDRGHVGYITVGSGLSLSGGELTATGTGTITGTLTTNELVYGTGASSIGSLAVATYPSLTELSYVKGVTSAIQTQIDGKANTALSNLAVPTEINTSLISDADNTDDLGSASLMWRTAYLGTSAFVPLVIGGTSTTADLNFQTTTGAGTTGSFMDFLVGNNGAIRAMRINDVGGVGILAPTTIDANHGLTIKSPTNTGSHGLKILALNETANIQIGWGIIEGSSTLRVTANGAISMNTTSGVFVGGTAAPVASAIMESSSTTKGWLPPRMTTTQKNAISSPAEGLIVYDTTLHKLCVYTGSAWETITSL